MSHHTELRNPDALVSTTWLEQHLDDPGLRIFDCSTVLSRQDTGGRPYRAISCYEEHAAGHIPGAGYLDLQGDFSRPESPFGMTLASPEKVAAAFEQSGLSDKNRVILYSRRSPSWAARFWWMLRWLGFDNAALLDGGFEKWQAEGRLLSTEPCTYHSGNLTVKLRRGVFVGRDEILEALNDPHTLIVNALSAELHAGRDPQYGRPGRIPGSVNVPQMDLYCPETGAFLSPDVIGRKFVEVGANNALRIITYCGGAIFATVDAFWLHQLRHDNVAVYDNSLSEWSAHPSLPLEVDAPQ